MLISQYETIHCVQGYVKDKLRKKIITQNKTTICPVSTFPRVKKMFRIPNRIIKFECDCSLHPTRGENTISV